jgi:hypothetical protein
MGIDQVTGFIISPARAGLCFEVIVSLPEYVSSSGNYQSGM